MHEGQNETKTLIGKETAVTDVSQDNATVNHVCGLFFVRLSVLSVFRHCYVVVLCLSCSIIVTEKSFPILVFCEMDYIHQEKPQSSCGCQTSSQLTAVRTSFFFFLSLNIGTCICNHIQYNLLHFCHALFVLVFIVILASSWATLNVERKLEKRNWFNM